MATPALRTVLTALVVAAVLVAPACATATPQAATPSPDESTAAPSPAPLPTRLVVAPGEKPPELFGGDCSNVLSDAQASELTGATIALSPSVGEPDSLVQNVGGIVCTWSDSSIDFTVFAAPAAAFGGPLLSEIDFAYNFGESCGWFCSWLSEGDDIIVAGHFDRHDGTQDRTRAPAQAIGIAAAEVVRTNLGMLDEPSWTRNRDGWLNGIDCDPISVALEESGTVNLPLGGGPAALLDPPPEWWAIAAEASRVRWCWDANYLELMGSGLSIDARSGTGWAFDSTPGVDVDAGVTGWRVKQTEANDTQTFTATDGVNTVVISPQSDLGQDITTVAAILGAIRPAG